MSTLVQQIERINVKVNNNLSLINGTRVPGFLYSFYGNVTKFGCFVNNPSDDKKTLVIDDADVLTENPDKKEPPLRVEEYANMSIVYGEVFLLSNKDSHNIVLDEAEFPSQGFTRNDIVYLFVGNSGPTTAISTGAASSGTPVDPATPKGSLPLARVTIDSTGIILIYDLRIFVTAGSEGTLLHNQLLNRDLDNQHTTAAIAGLDAQLAAKAPQTALDAHEADTSNSHQVTFEQTGGITTIEADTLPGSLRVGNFWIQTNVA